jgi:hypothetical protein
MLADLGLTRSDMKYVDMEFREGHEVKAGLVLLDFPEAAILSAAPEHRENDFGER